LSRSSIGDTTTYYCCSAVVSYTFGFECGFFFFFFKDTGDVGVVVVWEGDHLDGEIFRADLCSYSA